MEMDNFCIPKVLQVLIDHFNGIEPNGRNELSPKEKEAEENIREILNEYRDGRAVIETELFAGKLYDFC